MYEAIGLTDSQVQLYEYLVEHAEACLEQRVRLEDRLGLSAEQLREALDGLHDLGLVTADPQGPSMAGVLPPDLALESLIRRREAELQQVRAHAAQLAARHHTARLRKREVNLVEIVRGGAAIDARVRLMERQAKRSLEALSTPPYTRHFAPHQEELAVLQRGIRSRVIYSRLALEQEQAVETLEQLRSAGEEARIATRVPMKLLLVDRQTALMPLVSGADADQAAVVVHPSPLLDALCALFEALWTRSHPYLGPEHGLRPPGLSEESLRLLRLLAGGMKDETVARHMGLSLRTVRRRIASLMEWSGATTRFEAGYLLGRLAPARNPQSQLPFPGPVERSRERERAGGSGQ